MQRVAILLLGALVAFSLVSIETANATLIGLKDWSVGAFDWFFVGIAAATLGIVALLGVHPAANVRLGPEGVEPEFKTFSWFAMLFSAGLGSGLLYWAVAEPVLHYQENPFLAQSGITAATEPAIAVALRVTIFHWGLHGWGLYVLGGLAIAIYSYRHGRPLTIRTALFPILGERWIDRWPGRLADLLSVLGTVFGVAASIGFAAAGLNATLFSLTGLEVTTANQIGIVFFVCALGVISAMSGLSRGVRRLSEVNVWVSLALLLALIALGPTLAVLGHVASATGDYLTHFLPMGIWIGDTATEQAWQGDWTVFYWGWWLAWMPFVSLFIARISRGRTVREFVLGVMAVPTLIIIVWMSVLGSSALQQELSNPGAVSAAVNQDYSLGIVALIENLGYPSLTIPLIAAAAFLLFTWLVTSLDSATLAICALVEAPDHPPHQVFWGTTLAVITALLIWVGGVRALQAASIIIGVPLAVVTVLIAAGLLKDLFARRL